MLLPFSIRVAFVKFCVCPSFPFGIEGGMWDVIVFIPDHTNKITWGGGGGASTSLRSTTLAFCFALVLQTLS